MTVAAAQRRFVLRINEEIKSVLRSLLGDSEITLASGSPRRKEILALGGVRCRILVPDIDEEPLAEVEPQQFALDLACRKLDNIPRQNGITVAADTIVVLDNHILGKPLDRVDAIRMLRTLSGRRHNVITALAVRNDADGRRVVGCDRSYVTFHALVDSDIESYVDSGEPMDKAGAYGIQGMGELLVEKLEGSLHNVIGFPIDLFVDLLTELRQ